MQQCDCAGFPVVSIVWHGGVESVGSRCLLHNVDVDFAAGIVARIAAGYISWGYISTKLVREKGAKQRCGAWRLEGNGKISDDDSDGVVTRPKKQLRNIKNVKQELLLLLRIECMLLGEGVRSSGG